MMRVSLGLPTKTKKYILKIRSPMHHLIGNCPNWIQQTTLQFHILLYKISFGYADGIPFQTLSSMVAW